MILDRLLLEDCRGTIAAVLQCSRQTYNIVAPYLYRELTITRTNAAGVFCGLATPPERLRSSHPRVASAPHDINWSRFLGQDFYLEWARTYEAAPNEGLRSRREYLIWPKADAESGDEGEDDAEGLPAGGGRKVSAELKWPHPTYASHRRKQALLLLIEKLHIAEQPPRELCEELSTMIRGGDHCLGRVNHLSLSPKAYWALSDWQDRHPHRLHPFNLVLQQADPRQLCVQYPSIDHFLEKRFMMPRIVTNEEHLSRNSNWDQSTYLRYRLQDHLRNHLGNVLVSLVGERTESVTIHNAAAVHIPVFPDILKRVFIHLCLCQDQHIIDIVEQRFCYDHMIPPRENSLARATLGSDPDRIKVFKEGKGSVELIDADWIGGDVTSTEEEDRLPVDLQRIQAAVSEDSGDLAAVLRIQKVVQFLHSDEGEPCVCCGKKQLGYGEVSTTW
jgi:hypothetical protein